jgi:hypothetical protein
MLPNVHRLPVEILPQPDETTCGPTCLHALYRYWGDAQSLPDLIQRAYRREHGGGTFAVFLACDALRRGYEAIIYTYNLMVFDPTWFAAGIDVAARLQRQREVKNDRRLLDVTDGYLEFLKLGGRLRLVDLSRALIHGLLRRNLPILTGLSSTYLYRTAREYGPGDRPDDVRGSPSGHFVVISGYDRERQSVLFADPYVPHPYGPSHQYWVGIDRLIGAVLLGIVTHDANLLVIRPPGRGRRVPP